MTIVWRMEFTDLGPQELQGMPPEPGAVVDPKAGPTKVLGSQFRFIPLVAQNGKLRDVTPADRMKVLGRIAYVEELAVRLRGNVARAEVDLRVAGQLCLEALGQQRRWDADQIVVVPG